MNPEELDAEALHRSREALVGDLDLSVSDDEIRKTMMYAVVRFNLACRELGTAIFEQVRAALLRFDRKDPRDPR